MKYNGVYEVDPAFLMGDTIKWVPTGSGEYVIATKGGKKYFVKRNMHVRYPTRGLPKVVYEKYKAEATVLQKKQERLRALMKGLDWTTDHIVVEEENFWDGEKMFATITPCILDALPDTYDFTSLSLEAFLQLAKSASEALEKLHAHDVIHGDLKEKNILVSNKGGDYVAYLIDFDSSYPADAIPERDPESEEVGGSEGYQSPELIAYGKGLCDKDAITYATDIFSLGVVFHRWWAGSFPGIDLERGSVGAAVYLDKAVTINKKFNVSIGESGATLQSLINWMFAKDPKERPTAKQVKDVLADELEVPEAFQKEDDEMPFDADLWETHKSIAELLPVKDLKRRGVKSLKRINDNGGSKGMKYCVTADGIEQMRTLSELCDLGYATWKEAKLESPWSEHMIEFEPADVIAKKGYAKISRCKDIFGKRYNVEDANGRKRDMGVKALIENGLAHPKTVVIDTDTPWPEHGKAYCAENMARLGVKSISRMKVGGEHRYKLVYHEMIDGKNKENENVSVNNLKLMGFIK